MSDDPLASPVLDTQVKEDGAPGRYTAEIGDCWRLLQAYGGAVMTFGLRAIECAVGAPGLRPLSVTSLFVQQVPCGPVQIEVDVLRRSSRTVFAASRLRAAGGDGVALHTSAVFGARRDTPHRLSPLQFPAVLPPEQALPQGVTLLSDLPVMRQVETRWAHDIAQRPNSTASEEERAIPGPPVASTWVRFRRAANRDDGSMDPVLLPMLSDILAPPLLRGLAPARGALPFFPMTMSIEIQFIQDTDSTWILQHSRVDHLGGGTVLGTVELWDERERLVAVASQRAACREATF